MMTSTSLLRLRWRFLVIGALAGLLLPAAGEAIHGLLGDAGIALTVNYWHFVVSPVLAAAVGFGTGRLVEVGRERARAEREQAEQARAHVDHLGVGVYRSSLSGSLTYANDAFVGMFGYDSAGDLMPMPIQALYRDPDERTALLEELGRSGSAYDRLVHLRRKDGAPFVAYLTVHLHGDSMVGAVRARPQRDAPEIVPVCSNCDRARDERGEWVKLSRFVIERQVAGRPVAPDVAFSHGICASCAEALYGVPDVKTKSEGTP